MYAVYYWPFSSDAAPTPPTPTVVKGWIGKPRRTIPVERLREILEAQGSPWAKELADTVEVVEKTPPKSPKHAEVMEEVIETVFQKAEQPLDWTWIIEKVRAANESARTTAAIKHAEAALRKLRADAEDDDEEAITLIMNWMN